MCLHVLALTGFVITSANFCVVNILPTVQAGGFHSKPFAADAAGRTDPIRGLRQGLWFKPGVRRKRDDLDRFLR